MASTVQRAWRSYALRALAAVCALACASQALAGSKTWTGSISTAWTVAGNWSGGVPAASDDATIPTLPTGGRWPLISSGSATVRKLIFQSNARLDMTGGTLTIAGDYVSASGSLFNGTGGTVQFTATPGTTVNYSLGTTQFFHVIINANVDPKFDRVSGSLVQIAGNFTNNNTSIDNNQTMASFRFNGTGAQTITTVATGTRRVFGNLEIDNAAGPVSLASACVIGGSLTLTSGTFDVGSYALSSVSGTGTLSAGNGSTLRIGGASNMPAGFAAKSFSAASTVEYDGAAQTVSAETYGNLTLSGSSAKTMPGTALAIAGSFTMSGTASATAGNALTVAGDFTIGSGCSFNAGSSTHQISGDFSNSGAFSAGTSTVTFTGSNAQTIGGSTGTTFNTLTLNKSSAAATLTLNTPATAGTVQMTQGTLAAGTAGLTILASRSGNGIISGRLTRAHAFSPNTSYAFESPWTTLTFTAGSMPSSVTVVTTLGNPGPTVSCDPIDRSYDISPTGGSGLVCTLRLHYLDGEISPPNSETTPPLKIWRRTGTGPDVWTRDGAASSNTTENWVEQSGETPLGTFTLSSRTIANIVLTMAQSVSHPAPGDQVTYTVGYSNDGDGVSSSTLLTSSVPLNTTYVGGSVLLNSVAKTDAADADEVTVSGPSITVNLGSVAAGASGSFSYRVSVN